MGTLASHPAIRTSFAAAIIALQTGYVEPSEYSDDFDPALLPPPSSTLVLGGKTSPMKGYVGMRSPLDPANEVIGFCEKYPFECLQFDPFPKTITLTPQTYQTILAINRTVNERVKPVNDIDSVGRHEDWDYPVDNIGDCEDYVLEKRRLLIGAGFPRSAALLTVVRKPDGEGHAVLTLRTDRGDYILDNLGVIKPDGTDTSHMMKTIRATDYQYIKTISPVFSYNFTAVRGIVPPRDVAVTASAEPLPAAP
ncbi:MAG: transglutaminase-like cysteine peptidase [Micavibrio sp.]